ncbi:type I-B CRISPR-associated protein Cas7/Cst2/DevR [Carboxydothermus pertinax]|uniref:Type I-B CRISPR-associated protein Cas7/Cst2/DevR n=1 Tax=Carboxydothermus pertinax TaxID=870242 RepID=A0A1L8CWL3_9THEO|nr:type I-B CRISPR-associated protein Cas7/Cst2/DevR [Carboxydothermus pertinax]GAV23302.1 type I-B CRISPR-associated protein Cas7/Cst2/DevR [Carboxydothermus pertinax]
MRKHCLGFVLIDAPHSALNNAGSDVGARTENTIAVKTIRKGRDIYPYVSAQAWRYWWRDVLANKFNWPMSPIARESKTAFTENNPFKYYDDDVFGYMRAEKKDTFTRLSPLKCSPLVSVVPFKPVDDFGVMARHEGDPVPYEHQFYSTVLKGIFALDLDSVGRFTTVNKTGFKNISPELLEKANEYNATVIDGEAVLAAEERAKRAKEALLALAYLFGGAKQTLHLTDVSPKFVALLILDGGNHLLMNLSGEKDGKPIINLDYLEEVLLDYQESIISNVYLGKATGFMDEVDLAEFKNRMAAKGFNRIEVGTVKQMIERFAGEVENYYLGR